MLGSQYSFSAIQLKLAGNSVTGGTEAAIVNEVQEINIAVDRNGWKPDSFVLKKGIPVKWNINVKELTNCNREIIVKDYGL